MRQKRTTIFLRRLSLRPDTLLFVRIPSPHSFLWPAPSTFSQIRYVHLRGRATFFFAL